MEPTYFPEHLRSDRLILRRHAPERATQMFRAITGDRARLTDGYAGIDWTRSIEDQLDVIRDARERWEMFEFFDYGLFDARDQYLGNAGVHALNWPHGVCELGYWLLGPHVGKGYVTEAAGALTDLCFAKGFHRVEIRCTPENLRSAAVARRLGFTAEARLRENTLGPDGQRHDTLIFSRLRPGAERR